MVAEPPRQGGWAPLQGGSLPGPGPRDCGEPGTVQEARLLPQFGNHGPDLPQLATWEQLLTPDGEGCPEVAVGVAPGPQGSTWGCLSLAGVGGGFQKAPTDSGRMGPGEQGLRPGALGAGLAADTSWWRGEGRDGGGWSPLPAFLHAPGARLGVGGPCLVGLLGRWLHF